MNVTILRFETIDSTNTEAANQARQGADEGSCVIATHQTAGRGRHGRTWLSEPGAGLYFSVVLRPQIEPRFLPLITLMAGVAVYDSLREFQLAPDIKWVNDVLVGEKKISGILAETVETSRGAAVVLGIGINLTSRDFPDEIAETATSIEAESRLKLDGLAADVEAALVKYLSYWYDVLKGTDGAAEILDAWRSRSTYGTGKYVRVRVPDGVIEGVTDGLEENGALRVKTADGVVTEIQAGDVERLRSTAAEMH
jgi:BirA family biotin operon repressor/biotin-[acetyl-CoA-carboxylase] ligase